MVFLCRFTLGIDIFIRYFVCYAKYVRWTIFGFNLCSQGMLGPAEKKSKNFCVNTNICQKAINHRSQVVNSVDIKRTMLTNWAFNQIPTIYLANKNYTD